MTSRNRKHVIVVLVVLAVTIACAIVVPRLVDLNRYRGNIESGIENALGGNVVLGNISWGIANGIWLKADRLAVREATAVPLDIDLTELYAKVAVRPLFSKKVVITDLELKRPVVTLKMGTSRDLGDRDDSHKATMSDSIGEAPPGIITSSDHGRARQNNGRAFYNRRYSSIHIGRYAFSYSVVVVSIGGCRRRHNGPVDQLERFAVPVHRHQTPRAAENERT
jgi:hypothetical protein